MENEIKALVSRGFGRNRTRRLELTTSRGTDGELMRRTEREQTLRDTLATLDAEPTSGEVVSKIIATANKVRGARNAREQVEQSAARKHARVEEGTERLGKWLHLLVHNALALGLATSEDAAVRAMEPATVFELLLGRSALTCVEDGRLTMCVDVMDGARDRRRQAALIEVFNKLGLRCRGRDVVIRTHERPQAQVA
ncbi:MAG: hypothetical protein R3A52_14940 [Polyangiales bacterium]